MSYPFPLSLVFLPSSSRFAQLYHHFRTHPDMKFIFCKLNILLAKNLLTFSLIVVSLPHLSLSFTYKLLGCIFNHHSPRLGTVLTLLKYLLPIKYYTLTLLPSPFSSLLMIPAPSVPLYICWKLFWLRVYVQFLLEHVQTGCIHCGTQFSAFYNKKTLVF